MTDAIPRNCSWSLHVTKFTLLLHVHLKRVERLYVMVKQEDATTFQDFGLF